MKTGVHSHSIEAYRGQQDRLSRRAESVLEWLSQYGPATDREVMEGLGFRERNAVAPRITELMEARKVIEIGSVRCRWTGKTVRKVDVVRQTQGVLFN